MPQFGWFDVAGGKLTTYRLIGQQVVDRIVRQLGRQAPRSRTAEEPLLESVGPESGILPPAVSRELVEHYCGQEWAVYPDDVMLRRTGWRHYSTDAEGVAQQVAAWMSP